jgi:hypothetical protein
MRFGKKPGAGARHIPTDSTESIHRGREHGTSRRWFE